jgi:putative EA31 gene protein, phage lambda
MIVNCPDLEYDEIIIAIKSHMSDSSMLQNIRFVNKIYKRYFIYEYFARNHQLYNLPSIIRNDNERRFLIGLYKNHLSKKNKKVPYEYYERLMHSAKNNLCPLCELDTACELDHYLPKSVYPEFSVFHKNLIPICHVCNNIKNANTSAKFIHSYYDNTDGVEILKARITIVEQKVIWDFYVDEQDYGFLNAYKEMFYFLNLAEKYNMRATDMFTGIQCSMRGIMQTVNGDCKNILESITINQIEIYREQFGLNHWRTVMYKAILNYLDDLLAANCF